MYESWLMLNVIQPNTRVQFTAADVDFIVSVLHHKAGDAEHLTRLLADEEARDLILDDDALIRAVLERHDCLRVSPQFYFYVLVRHVFRRSGLSERPLADYVAAILAEFSNIERTRCRIAGRPPLDYFFDMLAALQTADDT